jgi:ribosomal protein S24E
MKYLEDFRYMALIETLNDVKNTFLSRREITCNFSGLGGKLKKLEAIDMVTKEFKLDGKHVVPILLKNHVGKPLVTGTFFVYDDETLAKKHVDPTVYARLDKAKAKESEASAQVPAEASTESPADTPKTEEKSE